jgi:hypothetical protein
MQRRPDRFVSIESSVLLDPAATSVDCCARYIWGA